MEVPFFLLGGLVKLDDRFIIIHFGRNYNFVKKLPNIWDCEGTIWERSRIIKYLNSGVWTLKEDKWDKIIEKTINN